MTEILTTTSGNLLYHHAVRLASVNIVEDATIPKLRAVVDLLSEVDVSKQNFSFQIEVEYTGAPGRPKFCVTKDQAPVVQTMDSAIRRINHYPVDNSTYPLDGDLSGG